jgi:hypothetical protein
MSLDGAHAEIRTKSEIARIISDELLRKDLVEFTSTRVAGGFTHLQGRVRVLDPGGVSLSIPQRPFDQYSQSLDFQEMQLGVSAAALGAKKLSATEAKLKLQQEVMQQARREAQAEREAKAKGPMMWIDEAPPPPAPPPPDPNAKTQQMIEWARGLQHNIIDGASGKTIIAAVISKLDALLEA